MWEQFSYYGMRALLVYYMVKQLLLGQERASVTYGVYTAVVYFTPIIGGLISDRWLGQRRSVVLGGSIMALGHFMMAFEPLFYIALGTIACGNGLFLPSLPAQINGLYRTDDPRRKSAYNIYYVGINLGGFLAPFVCGTIGEAYGWHWGFTIAGIGMVTGLIIYLLGGRYLPPDRGDARVIDVLSLKQSSAKEGQRVEERHERSRRFALLFGIALVAVILRGGYEQIGNTVALWIESADRAVAGFVIPMTWFMSLNPLLVMLMTPWLVAHWVRLAKQGREPSSIVKMSLGAGVIAISYLLLALAAGWSEAHGTRAGWGWLLAFFVVMTLGELHVLPIGLGLFGRLAPRGFTGTGIALWFLAAFAGNLLAGALGTFWSQLRPSTFFVLAAGVIGVAAALLLLFDRSTRQAEMQ
jgi:POT family proton-dependent oligopeptide transporter